jgi:hypothetical protein
VSDPPKLEPDEPLTEEEQRTLTGKFDDAVGRVALKKLTTEALLEELVHRGWSLLRLGVDSTLHIERCNTRVLEELVHRGWSLLRLGVDSTLHIERCNTRVLVEDTK